MDEITKLETAITHLESQRSQLGDAVVDAALAPLQDKIAEIKEREYFPALQRKLVTILMMDIVESTQVASHLDPEDTRDIIDGALQRMAEPIAQHNGHVTRFTGDGFKAVFGTPQAHEDDPEQAVRAGLAIINAATEIAKELKAEWEIQAFQVRVGVNTGLVAVGGITEAEDTIMGSTVNLTKRIEDQAPPNGLLISHDTYRHVRGIFDVTPLEPITAKGYDELVRIYKVNGAKPRSLSFKTTWVEGIETRMVGRDAELNLIKKERQELLSDEVGAVITIHGEVGIGKSRLLFEYLSWEETQKDYTWRLFLGRGRQDIQNQPNAMWRELFSFRFEILDNDPNQMVIHKLEEGFGEIFGVDEQGQLRAHFIGQLLGFDCSSCVAVRGMLGDPKQLRELATRYLLDYFAGMTAIAPVLILIEDLHWIDDSSLEILDQLGGITPDYRVLIINVARNALFEKHPNWGQEQVYHTILKLEPLTHLESDQLVGEILQKAPSIPVSLCELVISQAEGNPFYIEELIKMLIESGVILPGEDTWQVLDEEIGVLRVPSTLTGVLQARLDGLPPDERQLLQLAAVFGKDFWDLALEQVSEPTGTTDGLKSPLSTEILLPSLVQRELIFARGESVFAGTHQFSFKHILFRDVIYQTIPKRERTQYHRMTADWLVAITQTNGRAGEYAAVIADHYLQAEKRIQASDWYYRAGQRARHQVAMQEARAYITQAKELLPKDDLQKRWLVQLEWDEIVGILGDKDERATADKELLNLAQQIDDDNLIAHAYYRQAFFFNSQGDYQSVLAALEKALSAARRANNQLIETNTLGMKVVCLTLLGELDQARDAAELALAYARQVGDDDTLAKVLGNVFTYYQVVDISRAVRLIKESIEIEDRLGDLNIKSISMINLGYIYTQTGLFKEGVDTFKSSLEIATRLENSRMVAYNQLNMGLAYCRLGDHERSFESLETAQHILGEIGDIFAGATCQTYLGLNHEATGKCDLAAELFKEAYETLKQVGTPGYAMDALAGIARCALEMGNLAQADGIPHPGIPDLCQGL
jgi:class 3 adenylate cyclase/tetratricopeptide (TPR) repeat protein